MKAVIWGCCGSLPSPTSSSAIHEKMVAALWEARNKSFRSQDDVRSFLGTLPHSTSGTYKGNTSCVQIVTKSEEVILCDAGTGIRDYALSLDPNSPPNSYHIFVSHLHWDHIQGFPFFSPAFRAGNRITFHGFHREIESSIRKQMDAPCFPIPFSSMQADIEFDIREEGESFEIDGVEIAAIRQDHPGGSWGYRFKEDGRQIIYSTDSEHGPEARAEGYRFVDFYKNADILIFDGQYTLDEASNEKRFWGHSDHITGAELAARAMVRKLVVFHHEPSYTDDIIEDIRRETFRYSEEFNRSRFPERESCFPQELMLAYDGLHIET